MNKNISNRRDARVEETAKYSFIPFLQGRPTRDTAIGNDDVLNLIIAMHTSSDFDAFLEHV